MGEKNSSLKVCICMSFLWQNMQNKSGNIDIVGINKTLMSPTGLKSLGLNQLRVQDNSPVIYFPSCSRYGSNVLITVHVYAS